MRFRSPPDRYSRLSAARDTAETQAARAWNELYADACRACGLCVTACPERAITLARLE
ncbi:4Fe-4S binding protein [Paraburkholderia sp. UCT70]|uniref:4Fe-4S binding protein n=1 Tax=Paraburkholderia sp. UCT70 TaxID=2991068 RepID=UPI003D240FF7